MITAADGINAIAFLRTRPQTDSVRADIARLESEIARYADIIIECRAQRIALRERLAFAAMVDAETRARMARISKRGMTKALRNAYQAQREIFERDIIHNANSIINNGD